MNSVQEYFRLRIGDVFMLHGREHVVDFINASRARAVPLERKQVEYVTTDEKTVKFETDHASYNISPNSEVEILRRLGLNWRELTGQKKVDPKPKAVKVAAPLEGLPPKKRKK